VPGDATAPSAGARIASHGAAFAYDDGPPALTGVEFDVRAGQLVILLGPNGGGKTTLFRALTGELRTVAGALRVDGRIALLPQTDRTRLDYPVTALDVALMGTLATGSWWRRPGRAARERARDALALVGLIDRAGSLFGELSGGQRRRVLLARTLMQDAPIVALDEPMAGVDPASARVIDGVLTGLRDSGKLVLVTSHDVQQALAADRVLCLNRRQVTFGEPSAVLDEQTLRDTYEAELTVIGRGPEGRVVTTVQHHHHHGHAHDDAGHDH
jgi:manganese/iron transport system ATP-binding protein/manganese/zinc/iron transport system ATP- binding protein